MSTQHTPTTARQMLDTAEDTGRTNELIAPPWRVTLADPIRQPGVLPCIDATDNRGEIACGVLNEALADFIVRACNSHAALLAALRLALDSWECDRTADVHANAKVTPRWVNEARAASKLAEGAIMSAKHTPRIRLDAARRAMAAAERECPHWDYESDPRDHDCCHQVEIAQIELRAARRTRGGSLT